VAAVSDGVFVDRNYRQLSAEVFSLAARCETHCCHAALQIREQPIAKTIGSIYDPRTVSMRTETASGTHPCRVVTFTAAATPAMATVTGMGTLHYS
jgi:hypothetical protein